MEKELNKIKTKFWSLILIISIMVVFVLASITVKAEELPTEPTESDDIVSTVELEQVTVHFWIKSPSGGWVKAQGDWTCKVGQNGSKALSFYNKPARNGSPLTIGLTTFTFAESWVDDFGTTLPADDSVRLQSADVIAKFTDAGTAQAELNYYAQYTEVSVPTFTGVYTDNVAHGASSESHVDDGKTGYVHTFKTPADIPEFYEFLYWAGQDTGDTKVERETLEVPAGSLTEDTVYTYIATYKYYPGVKIIYHTLDGATTTEVSREDLDILANAPTVSNLKGWSYKQDEEDFVAEGDLAKVADPVITTTPQDIVDTVEVYAVIEEEESSSSNSSSSSSEEESSSSSSSSSSSEESSSSSSSSSKKDDDKSSSSEKKPVLSSATSVENTTTEEKVEESSSHTLGGQSPKTGDYSYSNNVNHDWILIGGLLIIFIGSVIYCWIEYTERK